MTCHPDDLPADSGDDIGENSPLIDIASASKTTKRPASDNTKGSKKKKRKTVGKYQNAKWQKQPPAEGMKRIQFSGTPCISNQVQSAEPLDIFELMFTDELIGHITQQTNLHFKQNIVGKIFKKHSRIQKHQSSASNKSELCTANDICLFIASILYRGVNQKPVTHMFYTKNNLFKTPGFKKILPQDRLVLLEKYIHFVDTSTLGELYNRSAKIEPIHEYLVECWQSLLTLEENISVDEALLLWKGRLS